MTRAVNIVGLSGVLHASGVVKDVSESRLFLFGRYDYDTFGRMFTGRSVYYSLIRTDDRLEGYLSAHDGQQYSVNIRKTPPAK